MIEIKNLHKSFNGSPVLQGFNLDIFDSESLVIIGRSGCGKSVLLKLMLRLLRPDAGDIIIDNINIARLSYSEMAEVRKKFGVLFQSGALFDSMTIRQNITLPLEKHFNFTPKEIESKVREALEMVGLPGIGDFKPAELSGGMRKRAALARAIVYRPKYLLYDEPTTGLDPVMAANISQLIFDMNRLLNTTSIVVTHDMGTAYTVAERIVMLHYGKILTAGTPNEIKLTQNETVRQFIEGNVEGPIKPFQHFAAPKVKSPEPSQGA